MLAHLDLFSGIGACSFASHWAGFETVQYVELDPFCQRVLRKNFGQDIELHGDITTFDALRWRGRLDLVTGGFPCQDISAAGQGAGLDGVRSSLWFEMLRVVRESRPLFLLVENSPFLRTRGIDRMLSGLAEIGYTGEPLVVGAGNAGFPHRRARCFVVAYSDSLRELQPGGIVSELGRRGYNSAADGLDPNTDMQRRKERSVLPISDGKEFTADCRVLHQRLDTNSEGIGRDDEPISDSTVWGAGTTGAIPREALPWGIYQSGVLGINAGTTARMDGHRQRIKALGNTNPPSVYSLFLEPISEALNQLKRTA